ncbi:MAG: prenyltransferase [Candidatus Coatesbacteria bacterium]|nr:prenyltransferase [Candidatus Coatesbacteria bacterium]
MNKETHRSNGGTCEATRGRASFFQLVRLWIRLSRPEFHLIALLPFVLGNLLAEFYGHPTSLSIMVLGAIGTVLIMLITYYLGEYFDYESDCINRRYNAFSGGSRVLPAGQIRREAPLIAALVLLLPVAAVGLLLHFYFRCGPYTIPLGVLGLAAGVFYSSKPVQWAYHGFGELLIGICYGWLAVNTGYYLQTGSFHLIGTFVALPVMTSIMAVILMNEMPDRDADKAVGKQNLVVLLGPKLSMMLYRFLILLTLLFAFLPSAIAFSFPYHFVPLLLVPIVLRNLIASQEMEKATAKQVESLCEFTLLLNLIVLLLPLTALIYELIRRVYWLNAL